MQLPIEEIDFPGNPRAWLAAIVVCGLAISIAAGWSSYLYGNILNTMFGLQSFTLIIVGVFILAFLSMLLRRFATMFRRWQGQEVGLPAPGTWAFVWVSFKLACLLAILTLGAVALLALAVGHAERMFQGFMLVVVCSSLLFLAGGAVQDISRLVHVVRR